MNMQIKPGRQLLAEFMGTLRSGLHAHITDKKFMSIVFIFFGGLLLLTACSVTEINTYANALSGAVTVIRWIVGFLGAALLLAGFSIYEGIIQLIGFVMGGIIGALLVTALLDGEAWYPIAGFILGGILGAFMAISLTYLLIFLSGMVAGGAAIAGVWLGITETEPDILIVIIGAVVGGIIMIALYRLWISALTAAIGAFLVGASLGIEPSLVGVFIFTWISSAIRAGAGFRQSR